VLHPFTDIAAAAAVVVIGLHVTQLYDANCYVARRTDRQYWTGTESPVCLCWKVLDRTDSLLARPCVL